MMLLHCFAVLFVAFLGGCNAFAPGPVSSSAAKTGAAVMSPTATTTALHAVPAQFSRRDVLGLTLGLVVTATTTTSPYFPTSSIANAATSANVPTKEELDRIKVGYNGLVYLLDNFEQETTVCRENGGECKRDADSVRKYLGLRSTTDPLFQIEKVFAKVKNMDIDPDKLESFFEATEDYNSAMTLSNSMAFISQFGEYNPGGGKDEVLKYLNESKKQVIQAKNALKTILDALDISP